MLSINGRFLTQRITGVQRYAHEMVHALDGLLEAHAGKSALEAELLVPPEVLEENLPSLRNIEIRQLGRLHGHAWEQVELPRLAQGLLLNFCNTFPIAIRRQLVVIHDASIYASPEGYTPAFKAYYRVMFATARYRNGIRIVTDSEFSRAERFDGIFFLDLPGPQQRQSIWQLYLAKYQLDRGQKLPADDDWTGAEIKSCCRLAALLDVPLVAAAQNIVPVAKTSAEAVDKLRTWASGRCLSADTPGIYQRHVVASGRRRISRQPSDN